MARLHRYPIDRSAAEWIILAPLLPIAPTSDRPRKWPLRTILDGIFSILRGGGAGGPGNGGGGLSQPEASLGRSRLYRGGKGVDRAAVGWTVEIVHHPPTPRGEWRPIGAINDLATLRFEWVRLPLAPKGLRGVRPRRWVAARTFSWFGQSRRLAKEYERLCETSATMIYATMSRLMPRRLARSARA